MSILLRQLRLIKNRQGYYRIYSDARPPPKSTLHKIRDEMFDKYLFWTNTFSAGFLMFLGDVVSQRFEYRRGLADKPLDVQMTTVGVIQGPLSHFFYSYLDYLYPVVTISNVIKKVLLDQVFLSPICIVFFFLPASLIEGKSWNESLKELHEKFMRVYTTDWIIWPVTQSINFYFVPRFYRVIYVNTLTTFYNIYLSFVKHVEKDVSLKGTKKNKDSEPKS